MTYEEALDYIHSIPKFRRPLGNEKLSKLLTALGNPQKKLRFIHIAGTNGKGSTAAMTAEILIRSGYRTGLFTSPYIEIFNERIRVNGAVISDSALAVYTERVKAAMETADAPVSEFAFVTAAAFLYFYEQNCDFVVLEVGMGGRLDATNVIDESVVSVICKIALDHTQYLGSTIEDIAREKCGIIRNGGTVVLYPNDRNVMDIIEKYAAEKNAELIYTDAAEADKYQLSLRGDYQRGNAATAISVIKALREKGYEIPETALAEGLANTYWQARFEMAGDNIIIDGAHNPDGMTALRQSLLKLNTEITLVMAMMEDKAYEECIRIIASAAKLIIATELDMPRCLEAEEIVKIAAEEGVEAEAEKNAARAIETALQSQNGIVCVCGSLYLAGEAKRIIRSMWRY